MENQLTVTDLEKALDRLERRLMMLVGGIFVIFAVVLVVMF